MMKRQRLISLISLIAIIATYFQPIHSAPALVPGSSAPYDSIHSGWKRPLSWRIGLEGGAAFVPSTNNFLKGDNPLSCRVKDNMSVALRADFRFSPDSREGVLYKGVYQGVGIGTQSFFCDRLLGTPVTAYVYQGAPIVHLSERFWLGYEWNFGAAFGWRHFKEETLEQNAVVSTSVTALMALGVKLHYALNNRWELSAGVVGQHFSNGNTSWPNAGVNTLGATIGIAYTLASPTKDSPSGHSLSAHSAQSVAAIEGYGDKRWMYDLILFGAWRKKALNVGTPPMPQLCPGKFGVAGFRFSPLRSLNRYVSIGPSLDVQWDESGGLEKNWVEGSIDENIKFYRPPFGKQISLGISANAELTMPIFAINAGLGYDFLKPYGEKRFYQSLTLKTFVTRNIFLNVGYRLADFKHPQNLMLGLGLRL